ncbi:hypothetical protein SD77_2296 [Bacillus badius]|uniref:Uncharacterized protein n=1 Tax=Bacillus badius TaxID=1455 RepID=A0ABR5AYP1_BACBA|nr:hypothetical protein SD78_2240 [Bacillus badius]KIL79842.1 hypothetical protein SD77_2296 [Bacillus badius]
MGEDEGLPAFKMCRFERLFEYDFSPSSHPLEGLSFLEVFGSLSSCE